MAEIIPFYTKEAKGNEGGANGGEPPYNDRMEPRVAKLEAAIPDIRERLVKIETRLEHTSTKADVSQLESTLLKWFIGTAIALTGLAFAAAKLIH